MLTVQGNFTQLASGTLVIPIRGTNAANNDFGRLTSTGAATLGGTLEVDITEGYAPPLGASFPFLSCSSRSGAFDALDLPAGFSLNYTSTGAVLVVTGTVPVQILSSQISGGQVQFGFNTIAGRSYTLERKDSLNAAAWSFVTNFLGSGSFWQLALPIGNSPSGFFRVSEP